MQTIMAARDVFPGRQHGYDNTNLETVSCPIDGFKKNMSKLKFAVLLHGKVECTSNSRYFLGNHQS